MEKAHRRGTGEKCTETVKYIWDFAMRDQWKWL